MIIITITTITSVTTNIIINAINIINVIINFIFYFISVIILFLSQPMTFFFFSSSAHKWRGESLQVAAQYLNATGVKQWHLPKMTHQLQHTLFVRLWSS